MWAGHTPSYFLFDHIKDPWRFCLWQWKYTGKKRVDLLTSLRDNWDLDLWMLMAKIRLPTWFFLQINILMAPMWKLPCCLKICTRRVGLSLQKSFASQRIDHHWIWAYCGSRQLHSESNRVDVNSFTESGHLASQRHWLIRWVSDLSAAGHTLHSSKD